MKKYFLTLVAIAFSTLSFAQQSPADSQDSNFKFDQKTYKCEDKWVIFPRGANTVLYPYGFIYLDQQAGFTFELQGMFYIDKEGKYVADTIFAKRAKTSSMKYRLDANSKNVALLPAAHFADLHIDGVPAWLKIYKSGYVDDAAHNFRLGFVYNGAGDSEKALTYLDKAQKQDPHYKGLAFEIIYAYNALKRYSEAENAALIAIKADKSNLLLYRELGYAYLGENNFAKAIESMKAGFENCPGAANGDKAEMAFNLAKAFNTIGNTAEYKNWCTKAKEWARPNTPLYNYLVSIGF